MSMMEEIKSAQLAARKERRSVDAALLTTLLGEAANIGKNNGNRETNDTEVTATIKKFIKNLDELIDIVKSSPSPDPTALEKALQEKAVLDQFLPQQLTATEIDEVAKNYVAAITLNLGTKPTMGQVMSEVKLHHEGSYDGKLMSAAVRNALA